MNDRVKRLRWNCSFKASSAEAKGRKEKAKTLTQSWQSKHKSTRVTSQWKSRVKSPWKSKGSLFLTHIWGPDLMKIDILPMPSFAVIKIPGTVQKNLTRIVSHWAFMSFIDGWSNDGSLHQRNAFCRMILACWCVRFSFSLWRLENLLGSDWDTAR